MTYLRAAYREAVRLGADCKSCPLSQRPQEGPVLPKRPRRDCKMIVCAEGPGPSEETYQEYLAGASGDFFDNTLSRWNIPRGALHITNATMCRPRRELSEKEWKQALQCCRPRLLRELRYPHRKVCLAYGGRAFETFTGIPGGKSRHYHGMPYAGVDGFEKFQILPSYHPAHVLRPENGAFVPSVWEFTKRAWDIACGRFHVKRWPKILIHPDEEALVALQGIAKSGEEVGFDVETRGTDPLSALCMCLGIAGQRVAVSLPWESYIARRGEVVEPIGDFDLGRELQEVVTRILRSNPLVLQNGPHDLLTAQRLDLLSIHHADYSFDILLAHAVVAQGMWHDLGYIAALETRLPRWKTDFKISQDEKGSEAWAKTDPRELRTYNAKDAWTTLILKDYLSPRLDEQDAGWDVFNHYMKCMKIAMEMQQCGVTIDKSRVGQHKAILKERRNRARRELRNVADLFGFEDFNPNSTPQMHRFFFQEMQVKPRYYSRKTGQPSLDEKALSDLVTHPNELVREASRATLRYRKNKKLLEYLDDRRISEDGRMHITWNPHGAKTMRWSSSPNLQNIPKPVHKKSKRKYRNKKTGEMEHTWQLVAPGLRDIFVANQPGDWIVCADYDQLELRIFALLSEDEPLIELFERGGDPHAQNAADMFGYDDPNDVSKDERDMAKVWIYQRIYDGSAEAIWKHVAVDFPNYTLKDSYRNRVEYDDRHPPMLKFHHDSLVLARRERMIWAPLSGHSLPFYARVEASKVYNYPVQHTAADILNPKIPIIASMMDWKRTAIVAQVHDELVCCGQDPVKLGKLLKDTLTCEVTINGRTLPFTVGVKMGPSYGEVVEVKSNESLSAGAKRIAKQYKERFDFLKRWGRQLRTNTRRVANVTAA